MRIMHRTTNGFTLIELVTVIGIATILAAFAISRINVTSFDTEGFANRAAAMVRYAQKLAIAQRRTVFVQADGNTLKLCYTNSLCTLGCVTPVQEPPGTDPFASSPRAPVTIANASFCYDPLGRPSVATTFTVTDGVSPKSISVTAETGYVQYVP